MCKETKKRISGLVRLRGGFSDTSGIAPRNKTIQLDEFDDDTRIKINNKLTEIINVVFKNPEQFFSYEMRAQAFNVFCKKILNDVFCKDINNLIFNCFKYNYLFELIQKVITDSRFNEVLDIIEYICRWIESEIVQHNCFTFEAFNRLFEQEYVGYRFVEGRIVAISDKIEIHAIEEACRNPYEGCRIQLQKAVDFLSDKNKDYKNSIKESISAVESICQVIVGKESATLGDALNNLEKKKVIIHPALKKAFNTLYGYTSDQGGIRHAEGKFESNVTFEEAKFMLVSCSAFINYLIANMGKGEN